MNEYAKEINLNELCALSDTDKIPELSKIEEEAFKRKTLYGEETSSICDHLKISETEFWDFIGNSRASLIKTM